MASGGWGRGDGKGLIAVGGVAEFEAVGAEGADGAGGGCGGWDVDVGAAPGVFEGAGMEREGAGVVGEFGESDGPTVEGLEETLGGAGEHVEVDGGLGAGGVALEFGVGVLAGDPADDGGEEEGEEDSKFAEASGWRRR